MSSSNSKDGSVPSQNDPAQPFTIQEIIQSLSKLLNRLSEERDKILNGTKEKVTTDSPDQGDGKKDRDDENKKEGDQMDMHNQLDKVCKELKYVIGEFNKLKDFKDNLSGLLKTLKDNVDDILADLSHASTESVKKLIERNLRVLRSNITKVKVQIPLQRRVSSGSEARGYLQTRAVGKELGSLPNPYEAHEIFESGSFLKEFRDHYRDLAKRDKLCLLCFAIFPENAEVKKRLLRFWWDGEMLTPSPVSGTGERSTPSPNSDAGESSTPSPDSHTKCFVNKTLDKFVKMGFIEPVTKRSRSQTTSYKMHPIIRSFIVKRAKEANFFDYDLKGEPTMEISESKKSCLVKSENTSWFSKNPLSKPDPTGEKLRQEKEKIMKNLEVLQTLFNVSKQFPDLPEELFSKMRNIGVLYLGRWESTAEHHIEVENTNFLTGLKNLKKLRFFSLQGISGISKLENFLCQLNKLRILDLRACHNLEELPKGIGSLKKLIYLDLSECYLLDKIPKQLSQLSQLEVLKGFVISKNSSCTLGSLTALPNLKKLSINVNDKDFSIKKEEANFLKFEALEKLKIAWGAMERGAKRTSGNEVNNETKATRRDKGEKKGNGNPKSNADKSTDRKKQESEASKSRAVMKVQNLKIQWGACGKGSPTKPDNKKDATSQKLVKLDLECFPERELPTWLDPEKLTSLKRLYIRGGALSNLGANEKKWEVESLRLKYLTNIKINWKELQKQFPKLNHLEKVQCPQITFCPCDASGVWKLKQP
ncbi:uncharacterized protein LOC111290809 [Durio zibethinus]|uniref:Uncharacterized protein LOC111290809 n=1 Tax=Durio zibethinus TaxID=66656 RepID=A0A6P5YD87_DURZI|nr:uncharacterized protein LOC111290809 [Durio zibethinus]